jgi:putative chitinase
LIQLTGRANYRAYGVILGLNLEGDPQLAADPPTSLVVACEFWTQHGLNALADADNIVSITQRINGGQNGIGDRRACLARAKAALGLPASDAVVTTGRPVLRQGDSGPDVTVLQTALTDHRFAVSADGVFGPGTETAVKQFQLSAGLTGDGVVGSQTWAALGSP